MMNIPEEIQHDVKNELQKNGEEIHLKNFTPASGGCINNGGKLMTSTGDYFVKWNSATRFPGMFKTEADGLRLLASANVIKIPEVIGYGEGDTYSWILLEYIESAGRSENYWETLGQQLADLHKKSGEAYGLDHDNYIGSLQQKNDYLDNWVEFLITRRYEPMVAMALKENKIAGEDAKNFEKLYGKIRSLLVHEQPSLIHGDLWSGNLITGNDGNPALIDPAVYYGNREIELAFTTLFGGFDNTFYESYMAAWPLEGGYRDRFEIYNLYPLMVHVNLFGGGYVSQVRNILKRFV